MSTAPDLSRELELALSLAEVGGKLALDMQREGTEALGVQQKPNDGGPVTKADIAVDAFITKALREQFPGDAILAEESHVGGEQKHHRVWMIDPIDGTSDFAAGDSSWAVHIGLSIGGEAVLGVVAEPARARYSWGVTVGPQRGAWTRQPDLTTTFLGEPVPRNDNELRLISSAWHHAPVTDAAAAALSIGPERRIRTGSTGVKIAAVARGEADLYMHPSSGTKMWDSCAPQAILVAAGGRLSDIGGLALRFEGEDIGNWRGLLATRGTNHDKVVQTIAPAVGEWLASRRIPSAG